MASKVEIGTVEFQHVSKRYRLGTSGTLRGTMSALLSRNGGAESYKQTIWALQDVSFRVEPGGALGLIGPNGAGKTTTLKLLSKITMPTSGHVKIHGRVSSLIELGAGFHPELTGRDNIYLNGAILGLRRTEIARKFDDIVAFSELERFIDTPVKRYSSGMYVRLGFAVAAHVEPDVLLVDEVLAVGDAGFRQRCTEHMRKLRQKGTTVVFVSHNMHQVRDMCESVLLFAEGEIRAVGEPSEVITAYERLTRAAEFDREAKEDRPHPFFDDQGSLLLTKIDVVAPSQDAQAGLASHLPATFNIHYAAASRQEIGRVDVRIIRKDGTVCSATDSVGGSSAGKQLRELSGKGVIQVTYEPLQLTTGTYTVLVQITDPGDGIVVAAGESRPFTVYEGYCLHEPGIYNPLVRWSRQSLEAG